MKIHLLIPILALSLSPIAMRGQAQNGKSEGSSEQAQELIDDYNFDEAISVVQKELTTAQRKKKPTAGLEAQLHQAQLGANMLGGTEKIVFIDSMVVPRKQFLSRFHLSEGCGKVDVPARLLESLSSMNTGFSAYQNELEDRIIFTVHDNKGRSRLYTADRLDNSWSKPRPLPGLEGDSIQDFPYLMPDGVTLYYAAQGEKSLGGYDIFVTRYDTETQQYLQPENIGMPFNSPANDYLYVIDEQAQIGWFVTDRNQPDDTVCIYRFIPNASREIYERTGENEEQIRSAAQIRSIKESQNQKTTEIAAALERLKSIGQESESDGLGNFRFVINDTKVYTSLSQFRQARAREMAANWTEKNEELNAAAQQLDTLRIQFHEQPGSTLRERILRLEPMVRQLEEEVAGLAKEIRKIELQ